MKSNRHYLIFTILLLFTSFKVVNACDYSDQVELGALASNVKVNYEVSPEPDIYFTINILNLPEDIYAVVLNNVTKEQKTYEYNSENKGNISFKSNEIHKKIEYVITLYSKKAGCNQMVLRTLRVITPRYNPYYISYMCEDVKEYVLCQKWSDFNYSATEMQAKIAQYKAGLIKDEDKNNQPEDNQNIWENIINFIINYYLYFIISGAVIAVGAIVFIIVKRKRSVL